MLSLLIPLFNFDACNFVHDLQKQCNEAGIEYEILCYDDGSEEEYKILNRKLSSLNSIKYQELPSNIGRSRIRNLLGWEAKFPFLLFTDCDSKVVSPNFIKKYLEQKLEKGVTCGGRCYEGLRPSVDKILHWKYGTRREQIASEKRQSQPYCSFMSNNFIIDRDTFLSICFNEEMNGYGHEDTWFGIELHKRNIPIRHIDNPLFHIGLENSEEFICKTEQGIVNLLLLLKQNPDTEEIKIIRYYKRSRSLGLHGFLLRIFRVFKKSIRKNLFSAKPSLLLFDFYKLGLMIDKSQPFAPRA